MMVKDKAALNTRQCRASKPDRRAVADHDDVIRPARVVKVPQSQVAQHRQISVKNIAATLAAGHGDTEFALAPALIDAGELRDGGIIGSILQITRLHLVDSVDFASAHGEFITDLISCLRRPPGDRV